MDTGLHDLAGHPADPADDEARQACLAELRPVIARLQRQGMTASIIIGALALAICQLADAQRRH